MGWEVLFVAVDDASRIAYAALLPEECSECAVKFLDDAVAWFAAHGVRVTGVMTDNGSIFTSAAFRQACQRCNVRHLRTRPYRPQTNGKVERMIQTLLREWAYRFTYSDSDERSRWLPRYLHFYNFHRTHSALHYNPPISRLTENNVLVLNS